MHTYKEFVDDISGKCYILVESGINCALWPRDEYNSNDLYEEITNWLYSVDKAHQTKESPLDFNGDFDD